MLPENERVLRMQQGWTKRYAALHVTSIIAFIRWVFLDGKFYTM